MENQSLREIVSDASAITKISLKKITPLNDEKSYEGENDRFRIGYDIESKDTEVLSIYRKNPKFDNTLFEEALSIGLSSKFPDLNTISVMVNNHTSFVERYSSFNNERIRKSNPFLYALAKSTKSRLPEGNMGVVGMPYKTDEEIIQAVKTFISL